MRKPRTRVGTSPRRDGAGAIGKRPFRVHIDPAQDGAEIVSGVADRVRAELLRDIGLGDLLAPREGPAEPDRDER